MKRCGLLGEKLSHSYSPAIHSLLCDYEYKLYECNREELDGFLQSKIWDGLNVTIPYKKAVIPYCDALSPLAMRIGSVNTLIRRQDGTLYGDNTDAYGFAGMVRRSGVAVAGKKVLVLGSGGASVTAQAVLEELGAQVVVISRSGEENYRNLARHADARLIVNTTPVGMYPHNGDSPVDLRLFPQCEAVLDVVYNPARTALCLQAEALGIPAYSGLYMLVAQAKWAAEQFAGITIDDGRIEEIEHILARRMQNIVLVGMPGCGKSTVAALLGEQLGRPVYEADHLIEERAGMTIPQIFAQHGETYFRSLETAVLADLGKLSGAVISTGGGCVTRRENYDLLHQNGTILWLQRDIVALPTEGRPISQSTGLQQLYRIRKPLYKAFADDVVSNTGTPEDTAAAILTILNRGGNT